MEHKNRFPVRGLQGRLPPKLRSRPRPSARVPAAQSVRVLVGTRPLHSEGAGNAGCRLAPTVSARKIAQKARVDPQVQPGQPGIPCTVVYGLLRALLGETRLCCHRRRRDANASSPTWHLHQGARTTRLRRPRPCRSSPTHPRPPHPASRFVTIAIRPSWRGGTAQ
jgi:hypothetical protein